MRTVITIAALCLSLVPLRAQTKVTFDVKTHLTEKGKLALAKSGLISYLKQSTWASVVETRENYALWLKNVDKSMIGTKARIELDMEVQLPKLVGEGAVQARRHVVVEYDLATGFSGFTPGQLRAAMDLQNTRAMQAVMITVGGVVVGNLLIRDRDDRRLVTDAIFYASDDLKRKPTVEDTVESLAVGGTVMRILEEMRSSRQF